MTRSSLRLSAPLGRSILRGAVLLAACGGDTDDGEDTAPGPDTSTQVDVAPDADTDDDAIGVPDSDEPDVGSCIENAAGELPEGAEWLTLDGNSDVLIAMSDRRLNAASEGQFGDVYDINTIEYYGANGFYLHAPASVVAAEARFRNINAGDGYEQADLWAWPDFSSDGYAFDEQNPYGQYTRCVTGEDQEEWVRFVFPEPIEIIQPLHVFVGAHREDVTPEAGAAPVYPYPELLFEDYQEEAEYYAGIRWPDYDEEQFYGGQISPWYTWQVRVAVVFHDDLAADDKPFAAVPDFRVGGRAAWGDYDEDGDDDLMTSGPALWRNDDGAFVNASAEALPEGVSGSNGGLWADYDNDGCLDYFGQGNADILLHSECDGTFTDATATSGISDLQDRIDCNADGEPEHSPTEGSAWIDVDGDGFLDLYLANYECWNDGASSNHPDRYFHNLGDGTFEEVSDWVSTQRQAGRGATPIDFDIDGDVDLFVSNYRLDANFMYVNERDGMNEEARLRGVQGEAVNGAYGHTIGSVFGDIDLDGDFDLIQANLAHPFYYSFSDKTAVLINDGYGVFFDEAEDRGIYYRETNSNPSLFDADNDGDLDLFVTNVYAGRDSDFYLNDGTGHFTLQNYESGLMVDNGWGSAASDFDNDGDVDLVAYELFENRAENTGHFISVRAVGVGTNTSAIGAVVEVEANGVVQLRQVSGGSGTGCQDSMYLHFGLGDIDEVDTVRVHFPYGETVVVSDPEVDARLWVYSDGESARGWAPPR